MPSSNKSTTSTSGGAKSMAELMAKSGASLQVLQKGQTVTGTIKKLTAGEILMDIGAKGDALVIEFDRQNLDNLLSMLHVGDTVNATVISVESEEGFPVLSLRRMLDDAIFKTFDDLVRRDEPFEVTVSEPTRGGYYAETSEGIRGFLPSSQVLDTHDLTGKKTKVKIVEVDRAKKRVVFSQKATLYLMNVDEIRKLVKSGDKLEAEIANVTPYGLFVTIEKEGKRVEGFVHISEVSYDRVDNLISKFKAGEKITVEVVETDSLNKRVNLSIKRTLKDTFSEVEAKYKVEEKVSGKVTDVKSRGVSVQFEDNVQGIIPAEKVATGTTFKVGDEVTALVTGVDRRRRVVLLSPVLKAVPIGYR